MCRRNLLIIGFSNILGISLLWAGLDEGVSHCWLPVKDRCQQSFRSRSLSPVGEERMMMEVSGRTHGLAPPVDGEHLGCGDDPLISITTAPTSSA